MKMSEAGRYFPVIKLQQVGSDLHHCPKCNFLLKKIEVKVASPKRNAPMEKKIIWGCLGWNAMHKCRTQFEDANGVPDLDRELKFCI